MSADDWLGKIYNKNGYILETIPLWSCSEMQHLYKIFQDVAQNSKQQETWFKF